MRNTLLPAPNSRVNSNLYSFAVTSRASGRENCLTFVGLKSISRAESSLWNQTKRKIVRADRSRFSKAICANYFWKPKGRDAGWPESPLVFNRGGRQIKDFRGAWEQACKKAGVPELNFHDLRRTAVRNMRRAGVPQVIRMKISGHKTDSLERRYNIVDADDLSIAKEFMERRMKAAQTVTET